MRIFGLEVFTVHGFTHGILHEVGQQVIMCDMRGEPRNKGWRTIAGYKGTRDRLHGCDDDSTRML